MQTPSSTEATTSLRKRLLGIAFLALAVAGGAAVFQVWSFRRITRSGDNRTLAVRVMDRAQALAFLAGEVAASGGGERARRQWQSAQAGMAQILAAAVSDAGSREAGILATMDTLRARIDSLFSQVLDLAEGGEDAATAAVWRQKIRFLNVAILELGSQGSVLDRVALLEVNSAMRVSLVASAGSLSLLILLTLLLMYQVGYTLVPRLSAMERGTAAVARGDYSVRLPAGRGDEAGRLLEAFNAMTARLEAADTQLRATNAAQERTIQERTAALAESEERYRLLHESAGVGIGYYTPEGVVLSFNEIAARHMNAAPSDFPGRSVRELFPAAEAETYLGRIRSAAESPSPQVYEDEVRLPRETKWFHSVFSRVVDRRGRIIGVQIVSADITETKRTEEALRGSEARLSAVHDSLAVGIAFFDAAGEWVSINDAGRKILGMGGPGRTGLRPTMLRLDGSVLPPEELPSIVALRTGAAVRDIEITVAAEDGTYRRVVTSAQLVRDAGGSVLGAASSFTDVTEHRRAEAERARLEDQLQQAQRMEAVGRLAGGVAHDFNNLLAVILGHVDLALGETRPGERLHDDLLEIRSAGTRSAELTRQLLAFARRQTIAPKVLDLNECVSGMLRMLERLIGEDLHLAWRPGEGLWPVKMDPSQIDQILANLCVNARDAIGGVGKVTIETGNAAFDDAYCAAHPDTLPGEYLLLAVSDNGRGMDRETQSHIFEPFFTTKGLGMGTGLGLATVYGIVKQNRGFINVYSEPGHGTTMRIYLPRHLGVVATTGRSVVPSTPDRGHETILLVEDEPAVLALSRRMLESCGYVVLTAGTPPAALDVARHHPGPIDLLVTDVVMPEMNGPELAKALAALHPGMRRLFASGYTANVIAHHGVLDEGVSFIQKPFSLQVFAAKVREVLDTPI